MNRLSTKTLALLLLCAFAGACTTEESSESQQQGLGATVVESLEHSFIFNNIVYTPQGNNLALSAKSAPGTLLGLLKTGDYVRTLAVANGVAYLANNDNGLTVVDVANPSQPQQTAQYPAATDFRTISVTLAHGRLYAADYRPFVGDWRLRVFDLSRPKRPQLLSDTSLGYHSSSSGGMMLALDDMHLAFTFYTDGIFVYDVSQLDAISHVATIPATSQSAMALHQGRLFVHSGLTMGTSKFTVWNVQTPTAPALLGQRTLLRAAYDHEGNMSLGYRNGRLYAFLGGTNGALVESMIIVDVTSNSPGAPVYLNLTNLAGQSVVAADIDLLGNTAFISGWKVPVDFPAGYLYWLITVDISNPSQPVRTSAIQIPKQFPVSN